MNFTRHGSIIRLPRHLRGVPPVVAALTLVVLFCGCRQETLHPTEPAGPQVTDPAETGEQLLCDAIDEMTSIAEWSGIAGSQSAREASLPGLSKNSGDSVFVYGTLTSGGLGAVVTERHTHPKGLLLITVRKSYGTPGSIISEVRRFDSYQGFRNDQPQQTTTTEIRPASRDTIITYVLRNGITETYTFRLPVVTRVTDQVNQTVRMTSRYASAGGVVTEVTDQNQALIRRTTSTALSTGALQTRTDLPDGSWRVVTSLGKADGSILRETVSGH
jgi:hypothetical protein